MRISDVIRFVELLYSDKIVRQANLAILHRYWPVRYDLDQHLYRKIPGLNEATDAKQDRLDSTRNPVHHHLLGICCPNSAKATFFAYCCKYPSA